MQFLFGNPQKKIFCRRTERNAKHRRIARTNHCFNGTRPKNIMTNTVAGFISAIVFSPALLSGRQTCAGASKAAPPALGNNRITYAVRTIRAA